MGGRQQAFGPKEQALQTPQQQPAAMPAARMAPMTAGGRLQERVH